MIVVMVLGYVALLFVLVKVGVIKLNTFWKISPLLWGLLVFIVFFLPMQWGAPSGPCRYLQQVVKIVPNVNGEVAEVLVTPFQQVEAGDLLFTIDPTPFQGVVDNLKAQLELAEKRLEQSTQLMARQAGSQYEVQQFQSQVNALKGQLASAQWNLDSTKVEAPADGVVMGVTVRPGQRVSSAGSQSYMTLVVSAGGMAVSINQTYLRYLETGQPAEIVLKALPGQILNATVLRVAAMNPSGEIVSGTIATPPDATVQPFMVLLELEDKDLAARAGISSPNIRAGWRGGLAGTAAIYTGAAQPTHLIRKITLRMQAWKNYVIPG